MATTVKYYPLLKKGFQELADTGSIEADIALLQNDVSALQQQKITKVTDATQLADIADNEIFQWQTDDQTIYGTSYKNGYFYKKTTQTTILPAGTEAFEIYDNISYYDFNIISGNYYCLENRTPVSPTSEFYNLRECWWQGNNSRYSKIADENYVPQIGDTMWDYDNQTEVYVDSLYDTFHLLLSNGDIINKTWNTQYFLDGVFKCINENEDIFYITPTTVDCIFIHYTENGDNFNIIDFIPTDGAKYTTTEETIIGSDVITQINTQQQQLSVENNVVKYTLSDLINILNLAQLPGNLSTLLDGMLLGWNASTKMFETKTAGGGKYNSFDGTTFAGKTILSCNVYAAGGGYTFNYTAAKQTTENKLILYGIRNGTASDSVTLTDTVGSDTIWSSVGASLTFAYFTFI